MKLPDDHVTTKAPRMSKTRCGAREKANACACIAPASRYCAICRRALCRRHCVNDRCSTCGSYAIVDYVDQVTRDERCGLCGATDDVQPLTTPAFGVTAICRNAHDCRDRARAIAERRQHGLVS